MAYRAISGEMNLGIIFWGLGGFGTLTLVLLLLFLGKVLPFGLWNLIIFGILLFFWGIIVAVLVWKSSNRYNGPLIWKWLARAVVLFGFGGILLFGGSVWYFARPDFMTNSFNVQSKIQYDPAYPYIGFWKNDCSDSFGLVVEKAEEGMYFVRFCGPGGCFGKGPLSRVKFGEKFITIISDSTIGVPTSHFPLDKLNDAEKTEIQKEIKDGMLLFKKCS